MKHKEGTSAAVRRVSDARRVVSASQIGVGLVAATALAFVPGGGLAPDDAGALAIPDAEIWLVESDGSGERRLTRDRVEDAQPNFTPEGDLVFLRTRAPGFRSFAYDVWRMDVDGTKRRRLIRGGRTTRRHRTRCWLIRGSDEDLEPDWLAGLRLAVRRRQSR